ncbi:MAG TPA: hypothetical protein VII74_04475, partial [Chthoniobacterales bacterium]
MSHWIALHLWLIPLVPFAASLFILSLTNSRHTLAAAVAIGGQAIALLFALLAFAATLPFPTARLLQNFTWFSFGEQVLRLGFVLDPLTAVMLVMVTFVSLWIFVFSVGYMASDEH